MYDGSIKAASNQTSQRKRKSSSSSEESALSKSSSPEESFDVSGPYANGAAVQMPPLPSIVGGAVERVVFRESTPTINTANEGYVAEKTQGPAKKRYLNLHLPDRRGGSDRNENGRIVTETKMLGTYTEADVSCAMILARGMGR